jgi:hypothetical protein
MLFKNSRNHSLYRILTSQLLEEENDKCDDETYQISLP